MIAIVAAVSIWCSQQYSQADVAGVPLAVAYKNAADELCDGKYTQARDAFGVIVPQWIKQQNDGRWWLDTARGYFYSLIASGDDAKARNFLTSLEVASNWRASQGDRYFWDTSPRAAFNAYVGEADSLEGTPDGPRSQVLPAAAQASGDMNAAITILKQPSGATGSSSVPSLQLLMLGEAYETQGRWSDAFATWVRAANSGHAVPEWDFFDNWNLSAMEMIYYYRAHVPPDQHV